MAAIRRRLVGLPRGGLTAVSVEPLGAVARRDLGLRRLRVAPQRESIKAVGASGRTAPSRSSTGGGVTSSLPTPRGGSASRCNARAPTTGARSASRCTSSSANRSSRARRGGPRSSSAATRPSEELVKATGLTIQHVEEALSAASASVSLNQASAPTAEGSSATCLPTMRPPTRSTRLRESLRRQSIRPALEALPEQGPADHRAAVRLRWRAVDTRGDRPRARRDARAHPPARTPGAQAAFGAE